MQEELTGAWKTQRLEFTRRDPQNAGLLVGSARVPR